MNNLEITEKNLPPEQKKSEPTTDRLDFLNNEKFADIKEVLTKTITDLANEQIVSEDIFWNNIQEVTEQIFSDPLYDFDPEQKTADAQKVFLFRTKFEKIKKEENKEEILITEDKEETLNIKLRENLENKYAQIDNKYKYKKPEDLEILKKDPKIQENLAILPPEKHNQYLSYLYASEQIIAGAEGNKLSKENYEFVEGFISLNKELWVENSISLDGFSYDEIEEEDEKYSDNSERSIKDITDNKNIGADLVEYNADVEDFVLDKETNTINTEMIHENTEVQNIIWDKLSDWYQEDIQKGINKLLRKNKLDQYEDSFDEAGNIIDEESIPKEDLGKLKKIQEATTQHFSNKATEKITEDTNKVIKMKAIGALLQNVGQYFKIDNMAENFNIDLESGIEFNGEEMKLSGTMEWREMSFYYDMNSGAIFANDFVHYNKEDKTFYVDRGNKDKKGRERLPLKMPTLKNALDESQMAHIQAMPDALEQSDSVEEYEKNLNATPFTIDTKSNVADIIIEHSMAKNIATQETQDFLRDYVPNRKQYSFDKRPQEYNLYNIIDKSFDRYTTEEIKTRRNLMGRFDRKINEENPGYEDEMIQSMFDENVIQKEVEDTYDKEKWPKMYQFIEALTYNNPWTIKNDVIDLNLFEKVVISLEKTDGTTKDIAKSSPKYKKLRNDFAENKDHEDADELIKNFV